LAVDSQRFLLAECDSQGCLPLREVLAAQFSTVRGVRCRPENVIIFAGPQQARDTVLRTLLNAGDQVLIEDPCHPRAVETLRALGARLVGVSVDSEGLDVEEALDLCPTAKVAYISPRIQFPFGSRLSDSRRRKLERWACEASAWIVEDDYSSDSTIFDQRDQPLALDSDTNRTVLLGAFNKILFPSLRIAFAIVPDALLPKLLKIRRLAGGYAPLAEQLVLEEFIRDGHLDRHIRRSSKLSRQRLSFMTDAMRHHLEGLVEPAFVNSGTHLIGWLPQHEETPVVERGAACGLELVPLSRFSVRRRQHSGLLLGYGGFRECEIETGIAKLRQLFD
jgi:GntR family transcriptional regulator/MocR family aminotransferase